MPIRVSDDRGRNVYLARPAARVVSLVPSDTFTVAALGCAGALVGRTDYCDAPADVARVVPSVGGTKNPRLDDVCDLRPDVILANQEENRRGDLETLAQRGFKVYVAFPKRVAEGLAHVARVAQVLGVGGERRTRELVKGGYEALRAAETELRGRDLVRVFCPIWLDPLMTIHGDTFVSDVLATCGAANVFADRRRRYPLAADLGERAPLPDEVVGERDTRYPRVSWDEVRMRAPELVLLPDEPYAFGEADEARFRAELPAARRVVRMRGKDVTWYGAWSVDALPRLRALVAGAS
jgi:ABC-type Fe3+-hydroxamate transport system substrate-binding protein